MSDKKCKANIDGYIIEADSTKELAEKIEKYEEEKERNKQKQYLKS